MIKTSKNARTRRHIRVRKLISGTPTTPRLAIFRSNKNIVAQLIDDLNGVTIAQASTLEKEFTAKSVNVAAASKVGVVINITVASQLLLTVHVKKDLNSKYAVIA